MGDANTQRKERQVRCCNGEATMEIPRSTRFTLLLLVRNCLYEAFPDCTL